MTDKIKTKNVITENTGENSGAMVGVNSGCITVVQGMQYPEVQALCKDLIADEIARYRETALEEAKRRDDRLLSVFAQKLAKESLDDEQVQKAFETPSMQIDYQEAQKAFIKSGTPELEEMLSDILVKRVKEPERTLLQITLSEAIKVAPMLLPSQMATLALCFILIHTRQLNVIKTNDFKLYCNNTIIPIFKNASKKESEFQHLSFTGCSQISITSIDLIKIFNNTYHGIFAKGFNEVDILKDSNSISLKDKYPQMFMPCNTDASKWQMIAFDEDNLRILFIIFNVNTIDQNLFSELFRRQHMSDNEAKEQIIKWIPEISEVFDYWSSSKIKSLILSSVGIVIGAIYAQSITLGKFDLKIWI